MDQVNGSIFSMVISINWNSPRTNEPMHAITHYPLYYVYYVDTLYYVYYVDTLYYVYYVDTLYYVYYVDTLYYVYYAGFSNENIYFYHYFTVKITDKRLSISLRYKHTQCLVLI